MPEDAPLPNVKKATAILVTCLVETLADADPSFKDRFVAKLDSAYAKIRNDTDDLNALELLSWSREMVTGFSLADSQGTPFLKG
ncbi:MULTISPECIES: hypothetical protein [unclassified Bradyrhizobium]|uniref:hypothetical protein n=1 Tax=unclassified Bradyrhizobium TaxID=2631580 RepID=UPI0028E526C2|nr:MULTISPECIES: hypothetical protein [unclassified Bradyrhizobium]